MPQQAHEINFDGLVGPTHNYAGLSCGNLAALLHKGQTSNPRAAALEGLSKMKLLADMGVQQAVLPPHERPDIHTLRRMGFAGSDTEVLAKARRDDPALLAACCSASSMWAANAATVSPSADTHDHRVHFTAANLASTLHRSLESQMTSRVLRLIFADQEHFAHHDPLPAGTHFGDEGAANHTRFASMHKNAGVEMFVFGRSATRPDLPSPSRFPARQTLEASRAIARMHQLDPHRGIFIQQNPEAIDAGVFHNDVTAVGYLNVLLCHQRSFLDQRNMLERLSHMVAQQCGCELIVIEVNEKDVALSDAVQTYLFNSQIVTLPDGHMTIVCPSECMEHDAVRRWIDQLVYSNDTPIRSACAVPVRQSMNNGGGPACLRLRVVLSDKELQHALAGIMFTDDLYARLTQWVHKHYRESLTPADLADPKLLDESRTALDELTHVLHLGSIYTFQN